MYRQEQGTLGIILENVKSGVTRTDQDVQRMAGDQWTSEMMNALVYSAVSQKYHIPEVIMAEEKLPNGIVLKFVVDGNQRISTLSAFRYGRFKTTKKMDEYIVEYAELNKETDEWEVKEFDLRNKTFNDLPKALQDKFDICPLASIVYTDENSTGLVRLYNNHKPMSPAQKAFTYAGKYAKQIRKIANGEFFKECGGFNFTSRKNGSHEKIVMDTAMVMFHFDNWKHNKNDMARFLNENSSDREFEIVGECMDDLVEVSLKENEKVARLFSPKNAYLFIALYYKAKKLGFTKEQFEGFINAFGLNFDEVVNQSGELNSVDSWFIVNDRTWFEVDEKRNTNDKSLISEKLNYLETVLMNYAKEFGVDIKEFSNEETVLDFVVANAKPSADEEDIEFYESVFNDLSEEVGDSEMLNETNKKSVIAAIAYACENDIDLDAWFVAYANKKVEYCDDNVVNYNKMVANMTKFYQ